MKKIEAIIRPERVNPVKDGLVTAGFSGLTTTQVTGRGAQRGVVHTGRSGQSITIDMLPKVKLEIVVSDSDVERAIDAIVEAARTGRDRRRQDIRPAGGAGHPRPHRRAGRRGYLARLHARPALGGTVTACGGGRSAPARSRRVTLEEVWGRQAGRGLTIHRPRRTLWAGGLPRTWQGRRHIEISYWRCIPTSSELPLRRSAHRQHACGW